MHLNSNDTYIINILVRAIMNLKKGFFFFFPSVRPQLQPQSTIVTKCFSKNSQPPPPYCILWDISLSTRIYKSVYIGNKIVLSTHWLLVYDKMKSFMYYTFFYSSFRTILWSRHIIYSSFIYLLISFLENKVYEFKKSKLTACGEMHNLSQIETHDYAFCHLLWGHRY